MNLLSSDVRPYIGRTVDLLAFDGAKASGEALLKQSLVFAGSRGALTTGVQKIAQRFLLELLTEQGSLRYLPDVGSSFMLQLRSGLAHTTMDIASAFAVAEHNIRRSMRKAIRADDPSDERLVRAELLSVVRDFDKVSLRIRIVTEAGSDVVLIYPLRTNNF